MGIAFGGIVIMFSDSLDGGRAAGNLLALGVSVCFALNLTMLRKFRAKTDMLPTVMLAGVFSLVPAFLLVDGFAASGHDLAVLVFMGCVQLGAGCLLMTAASRDLSATELGLLALLEPILGPIWVWVLMDEQPSTLALAGAAVVLSGWSWPTKSSLHSSHAARCRPCADSAARAAGRLASGGEFALCSAARPTVQRP